MTYIVVLDFRSCMVRKYAANCENTSEAVEDYLIKQGLFLGQCEWMTSDEPITEEIDGVTQN